MRGLRQRTRPSTRQPRRARCAWVEMKHEERRCKGGAGEGANFAQPVRVKAGKPADGLIAFAQREGVTHVIFGQSARTRWELLVRGSTLDKFLGAVPDAAVQVVVLTET